jgi:phosphohistidine phosphatase
MELYILRNGEAGAHLRDQSDEYHRPLSDTGRSQVERVARWLADQEIVFDAIVTSPLPRARESAEIVAACVECREEIFESGDLEPKIPPDILLDKLFHFFQAENVLIVGHGPEISQIISVLIAGHSHAAIHVARGGLAKVRHVQYFEGAAGELQWVITPDQLPEVRQEVPVLQR